LCPYSWCKFKVIKETGAQGDLTLEDDVVKKLMLLRGAFEWRSAAQAGVHLVAFRTTMLYMETPARFWEGT